MSLDNEVGTPTRDAADVQSFKLQRRGTRKLRLFEPALVWMAVVQSFRMLDPREMDRNPVMFLVEVGTVLTAIETIQSIVRGAAIGLIVYQAALTALLFLTVLFANFASALAEARGKAQADSLGPPAPTPPRIGFATSGAPTGRSSRPPCSGPETSSSSRPGR